LKELPAPDKIPLLISVQDQCAIGWAAAHFVAQQRQLLLGFMADGFHRDYNSVKLAAQKTKNFLWGAVVQTTVIFNLSRAPWSSSQFWATKKESLEHLCVEGFDHGIADEIPLAAAELGIPPPRTPEEMEATIG
jgi:hypothetical protein